MGTHWQQFVCPNIVYLSQLISSNCFTILRSAPTNFGRELESIFFSIFTSKFFYSSFQAVLLRYVLHLLLSMQAIKCLLQYRHSFLVSKRIRNPCSAPKNRHNRPSSPRRWQAHQRWPLNRSFCTTRIFQSFVLNVLMLWDLRFGSREDTNREKPHLLSLNAERSSTTQEHLLIIHYRLLV